MKIIARILTITLILALLSGLSSCAKVGSKRWCKNMEEKPTADWTVGETKDYAKHCVFD
jgi:hypothetical protein